VHKSPVPRSISASNMGSRGGREHHEAHQPSVVIPVDASNVVMHTTPPSLGHDVTKSHELGVAHT